MEEDENKRFWRDPTHSETSEAENGLMSDRSHVRKWLRELREPPKPRSTTPSEERQEPLERRFNEVKYYKRSFGFSWVPVKICDNMIKGIFFARFLPEQGTKIVAQKPPGCIVPEEGVDRARLFDLETMAEYIIPKQAFCNTFVTIKTPDEKHLILGHPVCIKNEKYIRNEFMFNFCIVLDLTTNALPYEAVVRRLAGTFTEMELQSSALSQDTTFDNTNRRSIGALLEIIKEDLNNYMECMIPVDEANTINMKLFDVHEFPPTVQAWHVPFGGENLAEAVEPHWDLTMKKVIAQIDGVKDVRRIAHDADVALHFTKAAVQHLLFYNSIGMTDMFFMGNIYAPQPGLNEFIKTDELQEMCVNFVFINGLQLSDAKFWLCRLYTSLCTGRTLKEWLKLHLDHDFPVLDYVDVRRLIQFGLEQKLIYRVHKYVVSTQHVSSLRTGKSVKPHAGEEFREYADGCHSFDQIIVEKNMGDAKIIEQLRKFPKGDVEIIYR